MADAGRNPIIGVGFSYSDAVNAVAPKYPKVNFAVVDGFDPDKKPNKNVAYLAFAANECSYLVGVAAAADDQDQPGRLRRRCPQRPDQEVRGRLHRRRAGGRPEIKVDVNYIQETNLVRLQRPGGRQDRGGR